MFDQTVKRAMQENLISEHVSADGTLVRANVSFKSFVPIEVAMNPEEYKKRLRSDEEEEKQDPRGPRDPGNPTVDFRGEKRGNKTHRSMTDLDCRFVSKGSSGTGAYPGYTVNALMENRNRILLGVGVEIFVAVHRRSRGRLNLLDPGQAKVSVQTQESGGRQGVLSRRVHPKGVSTKD